MRGSVVVTGATGAIGREVVGRGRSGRFVGVASQVLRDTNTEALEEFLEAIQPRAVIHLAGGTPATVSADDPDGFASSVAATDRLLRALDRLSLFPRIVLASSAAVYGEAAEGASLREDAPLAGESSYARYKKFSEAQVAAAGRECVALRVFNSFGPGQRWSLVNRLVSSTREDPVPLRNPDTFVRDYVHVTDVARAFVSAADFPGAGLPPTLNIGSGDAMSSTSVVERLVSAGHSVHTTTQEGPPTRSVADVSLAASTLSWQPTFRLSVGTEHLRIL